MTIGMSTDMDIVNNWLTSGQTARICSMDLKPMPHGVFADRPQCIVKGQATVFFLQQIPQGNVWLLKIFAPARRPTDEYLRAVSSYLPGGVGFFTCTQRRLLTEDHLDLRNSGYKNMALVGFIDGAIMMLKVPGTTWASIADDLRDGTLVLSASQRLQMGINLAGCISMLEAGQCCHRDISLTNVFFDEDGKVYLIDWDCLYHPQLPFQPNTTVGTMGYIAPFLKTTDGNADVASSWCACADRFALAVLIAEILLVGPDAPPPHEDGTLFSQAHIDGAGNGFVREQIEKLKRISKPCAALAEQAFASSSFQDCPSPGDWIGALKYTLRTQANGERPDPQNTRYSSFVHVACANCGASFKVSEAKLRSLEDKGKETLCKNCFGIQSEQWSVERAQRNIAFPQICCEHCQKYFRMQREKLDTLLAQGKPLLCSACLGQQLIKWQVEHERDYLRIMCAGCGKSFCIRKDKLEVLKQKGKEVLCSDCLEVMLGSTVIVKPQSSSQITRFSSSLRKLIGRIANGYFL